jgi:peroxiredoxin Q/BCP
MVELRKRKAPAEPVRAQDTKKTKIPAKASKAKPAAPTKKNIDANDAPSQPHVLKIGDTISLDGFGGEFETHEGVKTTLKALVDGSKSGVILFTYPKASTPGCTKQVCMFRDDYDSLTSTGLSIYGLSADSPKANTTFRTKQSLPYPLLCDPNATLITALGFKKAPKGTVRGVCVVDKTGKIQLLEPGGPAATVEAVQKLVEATSTNDIPDPSEG